MNNDDKNDIIDYEIDLNKCSKKYLMNLANKLYIHPLKLAQYYPFKSLNRNQLIFYIKNYDEYIEVFK